MKKKALIITLSSIAGVLVILTGTFFIYTGIYYHTDEERVNKYLSNLDVSINELDNKTLEIKGENSSTGIIFYPGGKVEYTAYKPLLAAVASEGYTCLLLKMPFNLAVFDVDAASGYIEQYPKIKHWYLMGHSLGGVIASQYISNHLNEYEGLVLLGAYPDRDLSKSDIRLLSIYGSEDKVIDKSKYEASKTKWPQANKEYVIEGGCHAGFGMYGAQKGDGDPSKTNEEQIDIASYQISNFLS